jgi:chaperonin GroES
MSKLIPHRSRIIVKKIDSDSKSKTGLIISEQEDKQILKGQVLYVGEDLETPEGNIIPMKIKVNDIVFFSPFIVFPIKIDGEDLIIVDEKEILAIIRG